MTAPASVVRQTARRWPLALGVVFCAAGLLAGCPESEREMEVDTRDPRSLDRFLERVGAEPMSPGDAILIQAGQERCAADAAKQGEQGALHGWFLLEGRWHMVCRGGLPFTPEAASEFCRYLGGGYLVRFEGTRVVCRLASARAPRD
jgi:hypothetical protein